MNSFISVVIPVYNRGPQLGETVESVLAQTLPAEQFELIIVDDGSTDDTSIFLQKAYGANARVRLISQPNAGVAAARNRGLQEARGQFIAFLDHDDLWHPDKLRSQIQAFEGHPEVSVVYCRWKETEMDGTPVLEWKQRIPLSLWEPISGQAYDWLVWGNQIISMSVPMIRTKLLRDVGGFDPDTVPCDDWDLWLRLARCWEFAYVPEELVCYRRHGAQQLDDLELGRRAYRVVLRRQRHYFFKKPLTFSWVWLKGNRDPRNEKPPYIQAKEALADKRWGRVIGLLVYVAVRHPADFWSRQWFFLLKRLLCRDSRRY